jgi:hypothetical protein
MRVASAQARRDRDFLDQLGENLAALGILATLAVLDVRPSAVTRHAIILAPCLHRSS